jgi:DNA recombination protein Rad52
MADLAMEVIVEMLDEQLDGNVVRERKQAGRQLSYVEGWYVIQQANRIFGFNGWNRHTLELKQVCDPKQKGTKALWEVGYMAKVRIEALNVVREGTGFGSGYDKSLPMAIESAIKEAETDAMKRAFVTFGNVFGLALYDKEQTNVDYGDGKRPEPEEEVIEMTAAAMKKTGVWQKFVDDIRSLNSLAELKEAAGYWRDRARSDGWPPSYRNNMEEEFKEAVAGFKDIAAKAAAEAGEDA